MTKVDCLVFIGRFQPFHKGHEYVVREAFKQADHVILLIGSANRPRSIKNPFSFDERKAVIEASFADIKDKRLSCLPLDDTFYNDTLWLSYVQKAVASVTKPKDRIALIGHSKDDSSYYLKLFPMWSSFEVKNFEGLSATPIRQAYFEGRMAWDDLPEASAKFLSSFQDSSEFTTLKQEYEHIKDYKASYASLPYPPTFVTADVLVVASGHLLVVRRKGVYGQGLLALAGGFLDKDEKLLDCAMREAKEEAGIDLAPFYPKNIRTFDAPDRSLRGRTLTTVFHYELDALLPLTAGDDAAQAFWLPLSKLSAKDFFEDHYGIVGAMLGIYEHC